MQLCVFWCDVFVGIVVGNKCFVGWRTLGMNQLWTNIERRGLCFVLCRNVWCVTVENRISMCVRFMFKWIDFNEWWVERNWIISKMFRKPIKGHRVRLSWERFQCRVQAENGFWQRHDNSKISNERSLPKVLDSGFCNSKWDNKYIAVLGVWLLFVSGE